MNQVLESIGVFTPAFKEALEEEKKRSKREDAYLPPNTVVEEQPLTREDGEILIKFTCTKEMSLKMGGSGVGGDDRLTWSRRYKDQVEEARKKFYEFIDKGWLAFLTLADGTKGVRTTKFVPNAEEILMVAPVSAG